MDWNTRVVESIQIPSTIIKIGENIWIFHSLKFIGVDENNMNYSSDNGILYNKEKTELIQCPDSYTGKVKVLNGTKEIWRNGLSGCNQISGIEIPGTVKDIKEGQLWSCI